MNRTMKYVVTCAGIKNVKDEKHVFSVGEELMWQKGIVEKSTAKTLMNTIYFYNGKIFGFRAAAHRIIRPRDFVFGDEFIQYTD